MSSGEGTTTITGHCARNRCTARTHGGILMAGPFAPLWGQPRCEHCEYCRSIQGQGPEVQQDQVGCSHRHSGDRAPSGGTRSPEGVAAHAEAQPRVGHIIPVYSGARVSGGVCASAQHPIPQRLAERQRRDDFGSGEPIIDRLLTEDARRHAQAGFAATRVISDPGNDSAWGFIALSATSQQWIVAEWDMEWHVLTSVSVLDT